MTGHSNDTVIEPNQTIYLNNLNEKVRKDELKRCLYALCSQFGPILDVVAMKTLSMRGQAFIVFKDIASASAAIHKLNGFLFFDKPIKAQYAKTKSDFIAKLDGTYSPKDRKKQREAARLMNEKKRKVAENAEGEPASKRAVFEAPIDLNPPSNILFVQKIPGNMAESTLASLFSKFPGYKETKVPPNRDVAFVFYESEIQAAKAMGEYQGWKCSPDDYGLLITYAKR
ncbi:U1 small nuclear ribonucleoprotein A-like [Schistocerca gregaria]|uniref:U1 small nuclear ribonucleoprotein A-like n=1 Tax=Schistocerca gregaria TaxID=7010 RepID=UPI00211E449A|nr:U1 small nuclear ribonucleoprotein A-like [Schistocerca gregaria]